MSATIIGSSKPRLYWLGSLTLLCLIWGIWLLRFDSKIDVAANLPLSSSSESSESTVATVATGDKNKVATSDRPLILYAYFETNNSRPNLEYFIAHGLHAAADFLFILNGDNEAETIIPQAPNIRYIHRPNDCYDLGGFAEVLRTDNLYKKYNRFITLNGSIRGPFMPVWTNECWSDRYLSKLTDEIKLVGMTFHCTPVNHVQSMIWATDRIGMETLLFPTDKQVKALKDSLPPHPPNEPVPEMKNPGINSCPHKYWDAVAIEVYATPLLKAAGYRVSSMMAAFHSRDNYEDVCAHFPNVLYENSYFGMTLHPFDTIFAKTNRDANALTIRLLTEWADGRKYSSYDYCH